MSLATRLRPTRSPPALVAKGIGMVRSEQTQPTGVPGVPDTTLVSELVDTSLKAE
jgi:hypothetical protein